MTVQVFWSDPGQPKPHLFSAFTSRGRIWWLPVDRPPYRRTSPPTKRELRHRYKSHRQEQCWRVGCQQCCHHYLMEQWQISSILELDDYISKTVMNAYMSNSLGCCWWLQISLFKVGVDLAEDWAVPLIHLSAGLCGKEQGVYNGYI